MGVSQKTLRKAEVVVVGGGTSGAIAAIASARNGADTLIVESSGFLGGTATFGFPFLGFFNGRGEQVVKGLPQEVVDRLVALKASPGHVRGGTWSTKEKPVPYEFSLTPYDPEILKYVLLQMAEQSGVRFLLHASLMKATIRNEGLRGIEVLTKSGPVKIGGEIFVDTTGDAHLSALAGTPFELGSKEGLLQNVTLHFRMTNVDAERFVDALKRDNRVLGRDTWHIRLLRGKGPWEKSERFIHIAGHMVPWNDPESRPPLTFTAVSSRDGEYWLNMTRTVNIDPTDADDLTRAEIAERKNVVDISRLIIKNVPGFEEAYLSGTAPWLGVRESRRILGEYMFTLDDVLTCRRFEDGVAMGAYPVDIHDPKGGKTQFQFLEEGGSYNIPYRCLIPMNRENLIVAGKNISATHEAMGTTRLQATVMAIGQAAGTAAALSAKESVPPRKIDTKELRKRLEEQGAVVG
jgi:hypothetical protein